MKKLQILLIVPALIFTGCTNGTKTDDSNLPSEDQAAIQAGMANPASVNCENNGGTLEIQTKTDGGQYGICFFEDNRQCEEWALMRGECPIGGVKVTGYENQEQVYCAITGGTVDVQKNTCQKGTDICNMTEYFNGTCPSTI